MPLRPGRSRQHPGLTPQSRPLFLRSLGSRSAGGRTSGHPWQQSLSMPVLPGAGGECTPVPQRSSTKVRHHTTPYGTNVQEPPGARRTAGKSSWYHCQPASSVASPGLREGP